MHPDIAAGQPALAERGYIADQPLATALDLFAPAHNLDSLKGLEREPA